MKAADGEARPEIGLFVRAETGFDFPTSLAACAYANLLYDKPGRKMTAKSRREPSKMGVTLCRSSPSTSQVFFNLNCFSSLSYLLILFTIKIYYLSSIGSLIKIFLEILITILDCRMINKMLFYSTFP